MKYQQQKALRNEVRTTVIKRKTQEKETTSLSTFEKSNMLRFHRNHQCEF